MFLQSQRAGHAGIATYTLTVRTGEYADASNIVITDHLPNGLCPLSTTQNYAPGAPAGCAPGPTFAPTGASYSNVVANADGSFDLTFTPTVVPEPSTMALFGAAGVLGLAFRRYFGRKS